jgi:hypothetical protein
MANGLFQEKRTKAVRAKVRKKKKKFVTVLALTMAV